MHADEHLAGDVDLSVVASAVANPGRARMLLALADGRALPASVLAAEAGVRPPTASAHLERLLDAGLLTVEPHGRFRYYRLSGPEVGRLVEAMARCSPAQAVRSLREGTRAHAVRLARRCYDHLAGRLGVALADHLIERAWLVGGNGVPNTQRIRGGRLSGGVSDDTLYRVTRPGQEGLARLGIAVDPGLPVRCCVDWSEQRHHLAGPVGRALLAGLTDVGWLRPAGKGRALVVTEPGRDGLREWVGLSWPPVRTTAAAGGRDEGARRS